MNAYLPNSTRSQAFKEELVNCMSNLTIFSDKEIDAIIELVSVKTFKKGTLLLHEGDMASDCYYNFQGCVRQFYLKDGEEKTTFFYTEEDSISSTLSHTTKAPSKYYLECIEDTTLAVMSYERELELYKQFPRFESICRAEVEKRLGMFQEMFATYMITTPEERYLNLLESRPDLINRVPQYQLASFIGVKPESLSRIRKRLAMKS